MTFEASPKRISKQLPPLPPYDDKNARREILPSLRMENCRWAINEFIVGWSKLEVGLSPIPQTFAREIGEITGTTLNAIVFNAIRSQRILLSQQSGRTVKTFV